jgi:transcriptional regulator with XRE-family HTH domain
MELVVYVGDNLKRLRVLNALTQAELAQKAGLTPAAVARIERNEAEPRMTNLRKLAEALGVGPHELVRGEGDG